MNPSTHTTPAPNPKGPIVLIDNRDSFVYNLVDALAAAGYPSTVYRNTVTAEFVLSHNPSLVVLSPGPCHPRDAGNLMDIVAACLGKVPLLGICLGFQAIVEHCGGTVRPVGAVHGVTDLMRLTPAGHASGLFAGLTVDSPVPGQSGTQVPVARYHSLGCTTPPPGLQSLATCASTAGEITMAARSTDGLALGFQFHPESVLSPSGPQILGRSIQQLLNSKGETHA